MSFQSSISLVTTERLRLRGIFYFQLKRDDCFAKGGSRTTKDHRLNRRSKEGYNRAERDGESFEKEK